MMTPRRMLWRSLLIICALAVFGCVSYHPRPMAQIPFQAERAQIKTDGDVWVTIIIPTAEESQELFGVPLYDKGIQPVWLEVENNEAVPLWFLAPGLDPAYFSPLEAAYVNHYSALRFAGGANREMDDYFRKVTFNNPVFPGTTGSGFVFTNLDRGAKAVDIDLVGRDRVINMTFVVPVPGLQTVGRQVNWQNLYAQDEFVHYEDEGEFRVALEQLPCCTTNKKGTKNGDPLNLVLIGNPDDMLPAFIRRGWHPTEVLHTGSMWKTVKSALFGSQYRYSPISSLYVYGRPQDLAGQKARSSIHQRNHLRVWLTPMRFQGKLVWIGQISRDIGTRFTTKTWSLTTHKIDPDVDEARVSLIQDLIYSQALVKIGLVKGVGAAPPDAPRENLTGDPYFTDGFRSVLIFDHRPVPLSKIGFLNWEAPEKIRQYWERASGRIEVPPVERDHE